MWAAWMCLGAWGLKALQVCFQGMRENDRRDLEDDCWSSVMEVYRDTL
jgi:hypothetical protein